MPFTNEPIPEDAKSSFPFSVKVSASGGKPTLSRWTIDHEKNVALVLRFTVGGPYEGTPAESNFALIVQERFVLFIAVAEEKAASSGTGLHLTWHIKDVALPPELSHKKAEILQLIREALDACGMYFSRKFVQGVTVEFTE